MGSVTPTKRGRRLLPGLLARVLLALACVSPWVWFHRDHDHVIPASVRTALAWTGMLNAGFAYVAVVISKRSNLMLGRHGSYRDFIVVNLMSPLLYFLGVGHYEQVLWGNVPNELSTPAPYVAFTIAYAAGLHLSYAARMCKPCGRSLSMRELEQCGWTAILSYMGKFVYMIALVALHLLHLARTDALLLYLPWYAAIAGALVWCTAAVRKTHYLHLHHWFMGCLLTPVCHVYSPVISLANLGLCAAQFVEGASKWSCAPLWHARRVPADLMTMQSVHLEEPQAGQAGRPMAAPKAGHASP